MYSILQPKSDVEIVNERFMHGSPLSAMLRTNLMFLTNGIFIWIAVSVAATIAATALTITKKHLQSFLLCVGIFYFAQQFCPTKGDFFLTRHRFMKSALFICVSVLAISTYTLSIAESIFDDRVSPSRWLDITVAILAIGFFLSFWI